MTIVMKLKYNFIVNEVADKMVAVAVGADLEAFNGFIKMNDIGAEIFEILKNILLLYWYIKRVYMNKIIELKNVSFRYSEEEADGMVDISYWMHVFRKVCMNMWKHLKE